MLSYAICTTPRTGSTYLCSLLREVGLGRPDEWLHPGRPRTWNTRQELWSQQTVDGVFGVKLFWTHREDSSIADFDDILPVGGKWIFLRRRDTLSQARSYLTAISRDEWSDVKVPYEEFSHELVECTEARVRRWNRDWESWFRRKKLRPHRLFFEDLIRSPERTTQGILALLRTEK